MYMSFIISFRASLRAFEFITIFLLIKTPYHYFFNSSPYKDIIIKYPLSQNYCLTWANSFKLIYGHQVIHYLFPFILTSGLRPKLLNPNNIKIVLLTTFIPFYSCPHLSHTCLFHRYNINKLSMTHIEP